MDSIRMQTLLLGLVSLGLLSTPGVAEGTAPVDPSGDHWSFKALPGEAQFAARLRLLEEEGQPIDWYIRRRLAKDGLSLASPAAPHHQLRRLGLMLTGLPPDSETTRAFVDDPNDERYATLVEHYLQSPQFGERWARHWMDVVRYAETWGYEWNHLIREAWRYRDYLIRAFNQDLPYDQLVREHLAGDLFEKPRVNEDLGINESLIGTAFYRFGETGHDDCLLYPEISLDVLDNQIDTLSKAFQALTVSCSRCHDHKLDAISQKDYYALLGTLASSRQVIRTLDLPGRQASLKKELANSKTNIREELARIWERESAGISPELLRKTWQKRAGEQKRAVGANQVEHALYAWERLTNLPEGRSWNDRWAETKEAISLEHQRRRVRNRESYELFGDFRKRDNENSNWGFEGLAFEKGEGFLSNGDFSVLPGGAQVLHGVLPAGLYSHGLSQKLNAALRSPLLPEGRKFLSYEAMGERNSVRRTVIANCTLPFFHTHRYSTTTLSWMTDDLDRIRKSHLRPLKFYLEWATVLDDQGYPILNLPQAKYQETLNDPRSWFGITRVYLHDVAGPPARELQGQLLVFETPAAGRDELAARYREILRSAIARWSADQATENDVFWLNSFLELELLSRHQKASEELSRLVAEYRALEENVQTPQRIAGMADQDDGFNVPLLGGGEITSPGELVPRAYLSQIEKLISKQNEDRVGSGRKHLADMIAHPANPLTARVMANRIWHYLFGYGLVRSVDDFGKLGNTPEHPELLDYLARRLIDSGWSVKSVIREIVTSDTFRQSPAVSAEAREKDPENRLFHRYPSRRLEAEVIRDSILWASGRLDPTMFGPSVNPYRQGDVDRRKLYAGPLDGEGRRSLYLMVTRMGPAKMLELFNFPDPSTTRGRRDATNVPAQALGLLNHPFVHQQAEVHAKRLLAEADADSSFASSLDGLFLSLFSRLPTETERKEYTEFFKVLAAAQGIKEFEEAVEHSAVWKDLIHTLYNLKEFSYVL